MPTVFLSYSSADKLFARRLANRLSAAGVIVWLDESQMSIGDSLPEEIGRAISSSDYVLAIVSSNSVTSSWVSKELALATVLEVKDQKARVLPVRIDDSPIPDILVDKVYADFRDRRRFRQAFAKLLAAIGAEVHGQRTEKGFGGVLIRWTDEGPHITGLSAALTPAETHALLERWSKALPEIAEELHQQYGEVNEIGMHLLASLRACIETYIRVPDESEMEAHTTDLSRKIELFWKFLTTLGYQAARKRENGLQK